MNYTRVYVDALGYELPPVVVSTAELEARLKPLYSRLHIPDGQLESLTGINERRWWEPNFSLAEGATRAARKAMAAAAVRPEDIDAVIYTGVCREHFEPATACKVAANLGVSNNAAVYDISNACLGVLNGMIDVANRIELKQIRAGLVVSCETAREINEIMIQRMLDNPDMETFKSSLATLTGGSGAAAVLMTDGSFPSERVRRLVGGVNQSAPEHYSLCRWGIETLVTPALRQVQQFMATDSIGVLKHGVNLGMKTWSAFLQRLGWMRDQIDKVITHQVGSCHRDTIMKMLGIAHDREFSTFSYLGNIGTVSLPLTAALAEERDFLRPGDRVGFLGIGSGLNCLMLGLEW
jgi:acyl-CoA:acyl-CoA alkyltransferase